MLIELDGSHEEGGGAIVRVALTLSALTKQAFRVNNIRANRPKPGLKPQHLQIIKQLKEITNAKVDGMFRGSRELTFVPMNLKAKSLDIDIGTAGSITLLLQTLLPVLMFCDTRSKLNIKGGTDVSWSPSIDYFREILLPFLYNYAEIKCTTINRGYYPKGGGEVEIKIKPKFNLENIDEAQKIKLQKQGTLIQIKGISHCSKDLIDSEIAERQAMSAKQFLKDKLKEHNINCPITIRNEYCKTLSKGTGIFLNAIFSLDNYDIDFYNPIRIGANYLGKKGIKAEIIGEKAAEKLFKEINSKAPVDHFLADQLLIFMALIGKCEIRTNKITKHIKSNIYVIEKFLGKVFEIDEKNCIIKTHPHIF